MTRKTLLTVTLITATLLLTLSQCRQAETADVALDPAYQSPPKHLSEFHFFRGAMKDLQPNDRVLPYDLITPLFSDYAYKARFVWMPLGVSAKYVKDEVLEFPVGTVLIKNFYYPFDFRKPEAGRRIIETRLLVRKSEKWDALTYTWNEQQDEAELNIIGANRSVDWVDLKGVKMHDNYSVPNKNQCKGCHSYNGAFMPIGPKVRNLNHDHDYPDGKSNQLARWVAAGFLTGFDAAANTENKVAKWDDSASGTLEQRARAYLDVNCAHCHRPEGPANPSGLYLSYHNQDQGKLGIFKTPEAAGAGGGDFSYDIVPGHPEISILPYRMGKLNDPGKMMPQIGRKLVHQEGVELIRAWITQMVKPHSS
jgi:uncharacterized repeat protein (TIGR03806 family)